MRVPTVPLFRVADINSRLLPEDVADEYQISYADLAAVDLEHAVVTPRLESFSSAPTRARRLVSVGDSLLPYLTGGSSWTRTRPLFIASQEMAEIVFSTGFYSVSPRPGADPRYLNYSLSGSQLLEELEALSNGVTMRGFSPEQLARCRVWAPEISAQRAIADYLDVETARIDALIAKKQRMVELLEERRRSVIDGHVVPEVLGGAADQTSKWPVTTLKRTTHFFTDGDWIESPFIVDSGIRLIQTGNVGEGAYREQGFKFITNETFVALRCTEVFPGDVLISRLAGPVGCACRAPDLGVRAIASVDVVIMRPSSELDADFAVFWLSSSAHLRLAELHARGTTMQRLSRSQVGDLPIPLPPIDVQRDRVRVIKSQLEVVDRSADRLLRQIALLRERRQALITAAVTGELNISEVAA